MIAPTRIDESDQFGRRELDEFVDAHANLCVSMYLSTHRFGAETKQDAIRLKNLLTSADEQLIQLGCDPSQVREILGPAREVLEDRDYWQHQSDGLAIFCGPGIFKRFRLPIPFDELAVVAPQFHLRPVLQSTNQDDQFWLLALSQNSVRLFRGTKQTIAEVDTGDTPKNMADALANEDPEKQLQMHSAGPAGTAMFHGQGGGAEDNAAVLERYFRAVDHGLAEILGNTTAPLILAVVSYYGPIFRSVSKYPNIVTEVVAGSPDELSAIELHSLAWAAVKPHVASQQEKAGSSYEQNRAAGRTVEGLVDTNIAASEGRIEILYLPNDEYRWATVGDNNGFTVHNERKPGDIDLLNDLAIQVLRTGGVVALRDNEQLPDSTIPAAILRYA